MLRGMVRVPRRKRYQAGEDPKKWHALDSDIPDRVLVDALDPNAAFCDRNLWGCREENQEEIESADKTHERYETHQRLDKSLQPHEESHKIAEMGRSEI